MLTHRVFSVLLLLLVFVLPEGAGAAEPQNNAGAVLTIVSVGGKHSFNVELAETPAQMERGLMFRRDNHRPVELASCVSPPACLLPDRSGAPLSPKASAGDLASRIQHGRPYTRRFHVTFPYGIHEHF
jgi:hypothetical protein